MAPMTTTPNLWETKARAAKADRIAQWLIQRGFATDTVASNAQTPLWRDYVAKRATGKVASEVTWAMVIGLLEVRDRCAEAAAEPGFDPFAGLPRGTAPGQ